MRVKIDGEPATRTPRFIRKGSTRRIHGFTLSRKRFECTGARAGTRINTETQIEEFVARRQDKSTASGGVNEKLGEIEIIFGSVRWVNRPPGQHSTSLPPTKSPTRGRARDDVLVTTGGKHTTRSGYYATTSPRRPIWDREIGVSCWTVYDQSTYSSY